MRLMMKIQLSWGLYQTLIEMILAGAIGLIFFAIACYFQKRSAHVEIWRANTPVQKGL